MASTTQKYISAKEANSLLPAEVAEKYKVVNWGATRTSLKAMYGKFGVVDLKTLHISRADQLFKMEFPHLALKTAKKSDL